MKRWKIIAGTALASVVLMGSSCSTDAGMARDNLDVAAEQFEIERRVVFINGITDEYMLEVIGKCSYTAEASQVVVICKTGPDEFVKHSMVRSDNTTVVVEQLGEVPVDVFHHRVIFRPEAIVPAVDLETSLWD